MSNGELARNILTATRNLNILNHRSGYFFRQGWPIVSLDGKKKELIGNFKNAGQSWCLEAEVVNDHDFETASQGRVVLYGIYDVNHNRGYS